MNLLQTLHPFLAMCKFCGVLPLKWQIHQGEKWHPNLIIQRCKLFQKYSIFLNSFLIILVIYSIPHWYNRFIHQDLSKAVDFSNLVVTIVVLFVGISTLQFIIYHQDKIIIIICNLTQICDQIFHENDFISFQFRLKIYLFVFLFLLIATAIYEPFVWPEENNQFYINTIGFTITRAVYICLEQQFLILVLVVKKIIYILNYHLELLKYNNKIKVHTMNTKLLEIRNMYENTWEVARCINAIYAIPLLMWLLHHFVDMMIGVFFFIVALLDQERSGVNQMQIVIGTLLWTPLVLIRTFNLCWVGAQVKSEVQKLTCILQKFTSYPMNRTFSDEVKLFSHLLFHKKIEFQICGFSALDFSRFFSMYGAVTTYVVILIQFHNVDMFHNSLTTI